MHDGVLQDNLFILVQSTKFSIVDEANAFMRKILFRQSKQVVAEGVDDVPTLLADSVLHVPGDIVRDEVLVTV